jgi:hypothetical protein
MFFDVRMQEDRSALFRGLTGTAVPFGEYTVSATCEGDTGASSVVLIDTDKAFAVVSSAKHLRDYMPGFGPDFHVGVSNWRDFSDPVWAQLSGVFVPERVVDTIHPDSGEALLPIESSGSYILTVFVGGRILCRQAIRIDAVGGRIVVRATSPACLLQSSRGVVLQDAAPGIVPAVVLSPK